MPSSHPRLGHVLDEDMSTAFAVLRELADPGVPEAGLARKAVFDGAAFGAILREATTPSASQDAARRLLRDMRGLLATMTLPQELKSAVMGEIDRASADAGVQERRARQLALLDSPNPHGRAALDVADSIDAFDVDPA